ncbi:cell envelope integrity protein TolA [Leptospira sp. WS39.C2]
MKMFLFYAFILIFVFPIFAINTVILKNGKTIKGKVTDQNEKGLSVQTNEGSQTIPKSQILKVIYKDVSEQEAEKIRIAEEKKIKDKEEKEKAKLEKERLIAEAKEQKRLEEENKLAEKQRLEEEKNKESQADKEAKAEAEWLATRQLGPSPAATQCGGRLAIIWRSAVLPGWGQYCGGQTTSAGTFSILFFGTLLYSLGPLRTEDKNAKSHYDTMVLLNQVGGPGTRFNAQNISLPSEFIAGFVETSITEDFIVKSKNEAKEANIKYLAGLGTASIIYFSNLFHAYMIGKDRYPDRPIVQMGGKQIKEGWDFESGWDKPQTTTAYRPQMNSYYAEVRYSILF